MARKLLKVLPMTRLTLTTCSALFFLASLLSAGCDGRQPAQSSDGGLTADLGGGGSSDGPVATPDRGITPADSAPTPCPPGADPELAITLKQNMGGVVAVVTNVGCKTAYRMQGCCGEGEPMVQVLGGKGTYIDAQCSAYAGPCCDGEPQCVGLEPGKSVEIKVSALDERRCCGSTFRVQLPYSREPGCIEDAVHPALYAISKPLTLTTPDPCDGKTKCGPTLSCDATKEVCVRNESWTTTYKCAPLPQGCDKDRSCACVGKSACDSLYSICGNNAAPNTVSCSCPNC
jgi:hypothetical protein